MGIPLAYVQEFAGYWAESYDMRRVADQLNRYEQFTTAIDRLDVHLLHVRSPVQGATPCVMTHGWPGSVIQLMHRLGYERRGQFVHDASFAPMIYADWRCEKPTRAGRQSSTLAADGGTQKRGRGWLGALADRLVGGGAHPVRQLQQSMLANPVWQRIRQLP
jgi:hypothetical protein